MPITVRTGRGYNADFNVDLGQRDVVVRRGVLTPLGRLVGWGGAVTVIPERGIDIIHSINAVPLSTRPHVITFEDYLPRTPPDTRVGTPQRVIRRLLHRKACVRLLAMSEYAIRQFRWQNRDYDRLADLERKVELCYPAAPLRQAEPRAAGDTLRLLFVGRDDMRKGVPAILQAHRALRRSGVPVETTIVSQLYWAEHDYIGPASERLVDELRADLRQDGVVHHGALPNDQVLDLMSRTSFLALPTLHDTFGYVALEAMAAGTPVIATRTGALPEIVDHGRSGFLLEMENDPHVGKWAWTYRRQDPEYDAAYKATIERLGREMAAELEAFWGRRADYEAMSAAALETVRTRFGRERARARLETLYAECLAR